MAHLHTVRDDDRYFIIDPDSRTITHDSENPIIIARTDHNSERFTFEIPRYVEGHDMALCNIVEVHYINISSDDAKRRSADVYAVIDQQLVKEGDEEFVVFSWLLDSNTSMYNGSLSFAIRMACITGNKIDYSWRTGIFSGITVADTIDNAEIVVAQHSDILQSWYVELVLGVDAGTNAIFKARDNALEAIQDAEDACVDRVTGIEIVRKIEKDTIDKIESTASSAETEISTAKNLALNDIIAAEEEIVNSVIGRLGLSGNDVGYYVKAEEVTF